MEARAVAKYVRVSPHKARIVAELVRGKVVDEALNILHFSTKRAAKPIEKAIRSAVANMTNYEDRTKVEPDEVYVKEIRVDQGYMLKRYRAGSMGRAMPRRRRTCHITVVVADIEKAAEGKEEKEA
ncbi:MAG: 50S ribosomal protein L22 [candidate division KSB1 bacterium]|nr:50S ribosomal protein L22 [candidate division KSB1 bacterium]